VADVSSEERAKGIPILPEVLYYEGLSEYPGYKDDKSLLPIGIDMDTLAVNYLDFKEAPALVIGGSTSGKTNTAKTLIKVASGSKLYIFDSEEGLLREYQQNDGVNYANTQDGAKEQLNIIRDIVEERKEVYEEERIDDVSLTPKAFSKKLEAIYIVLDSVQQVHEMVDDNDVFDVLVEAAKFGFFVTATSDIRIKRTTGSEFMNLLEALMDALVLGNIRDQSMFSYTGIREDNMRLDVGYHHKRGNNSKIKLIENE